MLLVFGSSYIRKIRNARTQKSRDTGEHTNTSASYNKGENKKIASDFDACYPILFRKVYNLKSNTFQQVSCKIIHDVGVLLSLYTGIRVGELCALQWEDFDLAHSKLKIRKTMQRIQDLGNGSVSKTKIVITEPKSQCSIREIPLPLFIVDVAKKFASNPKAYILTGTDRYIEPRTMQNRFKSYVKECNVEPANFHVLRHTFATRCVEVGFEVKSLSEVLGHANVNITLNRYVHSSFELKHSNMNKLASQYKPSNM